MKKNKLKIFIDGYEGIGWSIDSDNFQIKRLVSEIGAEVVEDWRTADIIHNIWWNNSIVTLSDYFNKKFYFTKKPKLILTASNFIDPSFEKFQYSLEFNFLKNKADVWLSPSYKQERIFNEINVKSFYLPFSIDKDLFLPNVTDEHKKIEICRSFNISYEEIKGRVVIGSFQRDSLGQNLLQPKWQKNPDLLIYALKDLPKEKFILLLAGPRRHYLISRCKYYGIPYLYVGEEIFDDDLNINSVPLRNMPDLYALIDLYAVSSLSEGGPKAVLESIASRKFIISTDVGISAEYINPFFVHNNDDDFKRSIENFVMGRVEGVQKILEENLDNFNKLQNTALHKKLLQELYYSF